VHRFHSAQNDLGILISTASDTAAAALLLTLLAEALLLPLCCFGREAVTVTAAGQTSKPFRANKAQAVEPEQPPFHSTGRGGQRHIWDLAAPAGAAAAQCTTGTAVIGSTTVRCCFN
jgi:hypothetical protein